MNSKSVCIAAILGGLAASCQGAATTKPYALADAQGGQSSAASAPEQPAQVSPRNAEANSPLVAQQSWSPTEGVAALLVRAETTSPQVRQAFHQWQAAYARIAQSTALPNPWVSLGAYPMDGKIGVSQMIPWPGKLETAGDRQAALAEAQRMKIEDERLKVRQRFLRDWTERIYLEQAKAITTQQVELLKQIEDVSLSLYQAASVSQADVLRAQVERLEMSDRLDSLKQREQPLEANLEAILGMPLDPSSAWMELDLLTQGKLPEEDQLGVYLLESSPQLLAIQALLDAAEGSRELARLDGMPDFSVGADWTWIGEGNSVSPDAGDDAFAVSIAMEIPLHRGRIHGAREQAFAETRSLIELREQLRWQLLAELQAALAKFEDGQRRVVLFEQQLVPKAEMTYQTTLTAYQAGQAGFQDMLDAARVVLNFNLSSARAAADVALAFADLNGILPIALLTAEEMNR